MQASGVQSAAVQGGWNQIEFTVNVDTVNGSIYSPNNAGVFGFGRVRDSTFDLTSGTWFVCIEADSTANIGAASYVVGAMP